MIGIGTILGSEYLNQWKDIYQNYTQMTSDEIKSQLDTIKFAFDKWVTLDMRDPSALMSVLDEIGSSTKYPRVKYQIDFLRKSIESRSVQPEKPEPKIGDYATATNYLKSISNVSPENFELGRKDIEGKFGIDTSYITQDMYKEMNIATKRFYKTAEDAMASGPDIPDMKKVPEQVSVGQWKLDYQKETAPTPTTPTPPTAPSIENVREDIFEADTLEDARRIEKNHIAKYGDTLDIPDVDKYWAE
ncbi:unnamed protein product, partial [marine sediment metagenome]